MDYRHYDPAALNEMVAQRDLLEEQCQNATKFLLDTNEKTHGDVDLRKRRAESEKHATLRREIDSIELKIGAMQRLEPKAMKVRSNSAYMRWLSGGRNKLERDEIKMHVRPCANDVSALFPSLAAKERFVLTESMQDAPFLAANDGPARSDIDAATGDYTAVGNANRVTFQPTVLDRLAYYGNIEPFCTTFITAEGGDHNFNYIDDASVEGVLINQASNSNQLRSFPNVGVKTFKGNLMTSRAINVRLEAQQDTHFDLYGRSERIALARLQKGWTTQFTTGNGTAPQPMGFLNVAAQGRETTSNSAVTYADLLETIYSVDKDYRDEVVDTVGLERPMAGQVGWIFSDNFEKTIRGLLDGDSRPLWTPGIAQGTWGLAEAQPPRLLGFPYRVNNKVPAFAAGAKVAAFGNFSYFGIRTVGQLEIYSLIDSGTLASHTAQIIAFSRRDSHGIGGFSDIAGGAGHMEAFKLLQVKS